MTRRLALGRAQRSAAAVQMLAAGGGFATVLVLEHAAGFAVSAGIQVVVLAVVLGRSFTAGGGHLGGPLAVLLTAMIAAAATGVGWLLVHHEDLGDLLFVAGVSVPIFLRRYGPLTRKAARLIALPFIGLLVVPAPVAAGTSPEPLRAAAVALVAGLWVLLAQWLVDTPKASESALAVTPPSARRLRASDRMAMQMAVGIGLAFVVGRLLFDHRWAWVVLTAFVVQSGARGRGEVLHKGGLRLVGATLSTILATFIAHAFGPHDARSVLVIFVVLAAAIALRTVSYAFWAAGVTAILALLYGYFGEASARMLDDRLLGILLGAVIGIGAAWTIWPIRSGDVLRRRLATALAALSELLAGLGEDVEERGRVVDAAVAQLAQVQPAHVAHRRLLGRGRPHAADAIDAVLGCRAPVATLRHTAPARWEEPGLRRARGASREAVGAARRAVGRRPGAREVPRLPASDDAPLQALDDVCARMAVVVDAHPELEV